MDEKDIINPINGTFLPHLLLPLSQLLALTLPHFKYRKHLIVPIVAGLFAATYTNHFANTAAGRALAGAHWTVALGTIEKLLFGIPEKDYWRLDRPRAEAVSMSFGLSKLRWAFSLLSNQRGIDWNFQVKGVPPADAPSGKWPFLRHQFQKWARSYIISDLLYVYFDTYHHYDGVNVAFKQLRADTWIGSFLNALCAGAKLYFPIQMNYCLVSMITVLLGVCQPKDWPPAFGDIREATSVRKFWGSFWHQFIRKVFAAYSDALAKLFKLRPGTNLNSYFKLYVSFAISGITHGLMTWTMPANRSHSFNDRFLSVFTCFIGNAMAIHFEDIIINIYGRLGGTKKVNTFWKRIVGYLWVTGWIWFTCLWGANAYLKMGMTSISDVAYPFMGNLIESVGPWVLSDKTMTIVSGVVSQLVSNTSAPYTAEVILGSDRVIFTADHENIKAILSAKFSEYGKGPKFYEDWREFLGDSIFATDGRRWQDARNLIKPLFLRQRIEDLAVFEKHTVKLTRMLHDAEGLPSEVDMKDLFFRFTLDVATDFLFGQGINSLDNPREKFALAFAEIQRVQRLMTVVGPLLPFLSLKSYRASLKVINSFMEDFISRTLALPLDELEKLTKSDRGYTFLSALALYTRDAKLIRDQLVAVLLAGRDTTAATLSWVLHELSGNPQMVRHLREEIAEHVKPGQTPSFANLKAMKYLQALLSETLRMYPAIPFNMRIALEDTSLPHGGGADGNQTIVVKKDTIVAYTPLVMMRRDDVYPATYPDGSEFPDPNRFEPERWLHSSAAGLSGKEEEAEVNVAKEDKRGGRHWVPKPWTYIPFNGGPRICIGQQFALTEMGYTLVRIFQQYARVERRMATSEAGVLSANIVLTPRHGVKVAFFTDEAHED